MQQQGDGGGGSLQLPNAFALGFTSPQQQQQQPRRRDQQVPQQQRQPWPAAMFGLPGGSSSSTSMFSPSSDARHTRSASYGSADAAASGASLNSMLPGLGAMGLNGSGGAYSSAAAGGGGGGGGNEPHTPVGSPVRPPRGAAAAAGGSNLNNHASGSSALSSPPPNWFSPKSRVRYSDRFIPSRCAAWAWGRTCQHVSACVGMCCRRGHTRMLLRMLCACQQRRRALQPTPCRRTRTTACRAANARLEFSALDREVVADQVNQQSHEREVRVRGFAVGVACVCHLVTELAAQL
jgi:hypothetical protein